MRNTTGPWPSRCEPGLMREPRSLFHSHVKWPHIDTILRVCVCVSARARAPRPTIREGEIKNTVKPSVAGRLYVFLWRVQGRRARKRSPVSLLPARSRPHRWFIGYLPFYLWSGLTVGSNAALEGATITVGIIITRSCLTGPSYMTQVKFYALCVAGYFCVDKFIGVMTRCWVIQLAKSYEEILQISGITILSYHLYSM